MSAAGHISALDRAVSLAGPQSPLVRALLANELDRAIRHHKRPNEVVRHYIRKVRLAHRILIGDLQRGQRL